MSSSAFVYSKSGSQNLQVQLDVSSSVPAGATLVSVTAGTPSPAVSPLLVATTDGVDLQTNVVTMTLTGGAIGLSYGVALEILTSVGGTTTLLLVNVVDVLEQYTEHQVRNPEALNDLVGQLDAGASAVGTGVFAFETDVDPQGGSVSWELLQEDGQVYSSGFAFEYQIKTSSFSNTVIAKAVINAPSDMPLTLEGQGYQIRWTLVLPSGQKFNTFENIQITGLVSVPLGTQAIVELRGTTALPSIVVDKPYDNMVLEIYDDLVLVGQAVLADPGNVANITKVSTGYHYQATVDTQNMQMAYIKPWTLVFRYWDSRAPLQVYTERADFWVINPVIANAVDDMKAKINKARTTLYGKPDLLFPVPTILTWMRRAADSFNTWAGIFTRITFVNPSGPLREYWLMIAEMLALESQYLAEGEKAFDFQGQAISLTVDKTQYLDAMASKLQQRLDNELPTVKQNLTYKGNVDGDGSGDPSALRRGSTAGVGIAIHPATPWTQYRYGGPGVRGYSIGVTVK